MNNLEMPDAPAGLIWIVQRGGMEDPEAHTSNYLSVNLGEYRTKMRKKHPWSREATISVTRFHHQVDPEWVAIHLPAPIEQRVHDAALRMLREYETEVQIAENYTTANYIEGQY